VNLASLKLSIGSYYSAFAEFPGDLKRHLHIEKGPPIFVTGVPRSGTTWVGEMLSAPGVWHYHEPFNPIFGLWKEFHSYAKAGENNKPIDGVMNSLLSLKEVKMLKNRNVNGRFMPLRIFPVPVNRVLIKDPTACLLLDYLHNKFCMQSVVIFRHPAAFVNSLLRLDWPYRNLFEQFLQSRSIMDDHLNPYRQMIIDASSKDDVESAAVLYGCMNSVIYKICTSNERVISCFFEDLCMDPISRFKSLFKDLGLNYSKEIEMRHSEMCFSKSKESYKSHECKRNSVEMANAWRNSINNQSARKIRNILDEFEFPYYKDESDW